MNMEFKKKTQELNDTMLSAQGPYWRTVKDLNALALEHNVKDHDQLIDCFEDSYNRDDSSEGKDKSISQVVLELFPPPGSERNHQKKQKHLNAYLALSPIQNQEQSDEKQLLMEDESSPANHTLLNLEEFNNSDEGSPNQNSEESPNQNSEESPNQERYLNKTKKRTKIQKDRDSSNEITPMKTKKTKNIKKTDPDFEISPKKIKKIYPCQRNHPLKNFLQDFRTVFMKYLRKAVNNDKFFYNIQIIAKIRGKSGINMKDYQDLMKDSVLGPLLKDFFEKKVLYHHLMTKISAKNKIAYNKSLHVFERAYISKQKQFTSII